jgi:undecaprenyl-diphosphatase
MGFLTRYEDDQSRPSVGSALRDLGVRAVLPALALFAVIVGMGWLIVGPLAGLPGEGRVNATIQQGRTATWDTVTRVWSMVGNTEFIIGTCVLVVAIVWWRTRQWWFAVIPGIAISLQASIFVAASTVTGRTRPEVDQLDPAPPTSGFPSGHAGAATALYLTFAAQAHRVHTPWVRRVLVAGCLIGPLLVSYARLYRGMHYPLDVLVGVLNGIVCAVLAWGYLRRSPQYGPDGSDPGVPGSREGVDGIRGEAQRDEEQQRGAERQRSE